MPIRVGSSAIADHMVAAWHAVHRGYKGTQQFFQRDNPPVITNFIVNPRTIDLDQRPTGNVTFAVNCSNTNRAQILGPNGDVLWTRSQPIRSIPVSAPYRFVFGPVVPDPTEFTRAVRKAPPDIPLFTQKGGRGRDDRLKHCIHWISYNPYVQSSRSGVHNLHAFEMGCDLVPWGLYVDNVSYVWQYRTGLPARLFNLAPPTWGSVDSKLYSLFAPEDLLTAGQYVGNLRVILFDGRFVNLNTGVPEPGGGMQRGYEIPATLDGWDDSVTTSFTNGLATLSNSLGSNFTIYTVCRRGTRTLRNGSKDDAFLPVCHSYASGGVRALYWVNETGRFLNNNQGYFVVQVNDSTKIPTHVGVYGPLANSNVYESYRLPLTRMTQSGLSNYYKTPITRVFSNRFGGSSPTNAFLSEFWIGVMQGWEWYDMDTGIHTPFSARFFFNPSVPQPVRSSRYVLQAFNDDGAAHQYTSLSVTKNPRINPINVSYQTGLGVPGATVRFRGTVQGQPRPTLSGDQGIGEVSSRHFTETSGGDWTVDFTHHFGVSGSRNVLLTARNSSGVARRNVSILVP